MGCNCKVFEIIVAILIVVFVWWQIQFSQWALTIVAVALFLHALKCKNCVNCAKPGMSNMSPKSGSKNKKKSKRS